MNSKKTDKTSVNAFSVLLKTLSGTFRRMWYIFVLLVFTAVGAALLELVPAMILKSLVDIYLKEGNVNLWIPAGYYLLASFGTSIFGFAQVFVTTYIGQNILLHLRLLMADHLMKLPLSYYSRTPVGEIMSRITSDVDAVNSLFTTGMTSALADTVKIIGIVIALYAISPAICLIVLIAVPVVYLTADYFRRNIYKTQLQVRKAVGVINIFLQEVLNGMRIVKIYGKEEHYGRQYQEPLKIHLASINRAAVYDSYFPCVMQTIRAATIATALWVGAGTGTSDLIVISIGSLAAITDLTARLFGPVESLSQEFQTIQQAFAGLKRIVEFLSEAPEEKSEVHRISSDMHTNGNVAVELRDIGFGYLEGKSILKGVSMQINRGERVAIVGRTGAGKTTLMNLIAGLYKPWSGSINVMGLDPYLLEAADRRKLFGVVPQNVHVFEGTITENITLRDGTIPREEVEKAARLAGLHEFISGLEKGYDALLGAEGTRLSAGQNQLLSMARAVVSDPAVLLLDEPTSGMDAITEAKVFEAFRAASRNRTIITISHRLSGIIEADNIFIMASGRIAQSGTPEKLAGERGWYSVFKQLEDIGWRVD